MTRARTARGSSGASVSGTSGTLEPHGSRRRTVAPGVACTVRGIPSSSGRASVPAGVKLVVAIHTVRPGGGGNRGATRAVYTKRLASGPPPVAAIRKRAKAAGGNGKPATHAAVGAPVLHSP